MLKSKYEEIMEHLGYRNKNFENFNLYDLEFDLIEQTDADANNNSKRLIENNNQFNNKINKKIINNENEKNQKSLDNNYNNEDYCADYANRYSHDYLTWKTSLHNFIIIFVKFKKINYNNLK